MVIVAGYLRVAPGTRESYLAAALSATRLARATPGCLEFVQAPDPIEGDRVVIYERWESEHDLLAFRNLDPDPGAAPLPPIEAADVMRYEISGVGPA